MTTDDRKRGVTKETAAALRAWGNWYIMRTAHEFGWGSQWAVLNYHGLLSSGHKVLFDTPSHVRAVDVALGQLPEMLRQSLVLWYWWHRDVKGNQVTDELRARALGLSSPAQYREVFRTAKLLAEREIEALARRIKSATLA